MIVISRLMLGITRLFPVRCPKVFRPSPVENRVCFPPKQRVLDLSTVHPWFSTVYLPSFPRFSPTEVSTLTIIQPHTYERRIILLRSCWRSSTKARSSFMRFSITLTECSTVV